MMTAIDTRTAIESLRSRLCPACGGSKKPRQTLCYGCYKKLPQGRKDALYDYVGEGYEEAVEAAFKSLGVDKPSWPKAEDIAS